MSAFMIKPDNFDSLPQMDQTALTEMADEAMRNGLMFSPRAEQIDGVGTIIIAIAVMTPQGYEKYQKGGGTWEFISGVDWFCKRLLLEGVVKSAAPGEGAT